MYRLTKIIFTTSLLTILFSFVLTLHVSAQDKTELITGYSVACVISANSVVVNDSVFTLETKGTQSLF